MEKNKLKVVYYVNQFFGQEGGEERADMEFLVKEGPIGPGLALKKILGEEGDVVATVMCGDNYFAENIDKAAEQGIKLIAPHNPDLFFAGPAFEAGRYGMACGAICKIVQERLGIPAVTGMFEENPGVDLYRKELFIIKTERTTARMVENLSDMVKLAFKLVSKEIGSRLVSGENIGRPEEDGYFPRGIVLNEYTEKTAAERSVDMMLAKIKKEPFITEAEVPELQTQQSPPPIKNLSSSEIALISDGGLVPKGNPDGFRTRINTVWAMYDFESIFTEGSSSTNCEVAHSGYYANAILENPNRLVPVDVMRDFEKEGIIGKLEPIFYSTTGNAGIQTRCKEIGEEMGEQLKKRGVDGAILTST